MNKNILIVSIICLVLLISITSFAENNNETLGNNNETNDWNESDEEWDYDDWGITNDEQEMTEIIVIDLEEDEYLEEKDLEGKIKIKLDEETHPEKKLKINWGTNSYEYTIKDLLNNMSKNYELIESKLIEENPENIKTLYIDQNEPKMIGLRLPEFSEVIEFNMDIKGPSDNTLEVPALDIGNDDYINWEYLGEFVGWKDEFVTGEEFSESEGDFTLLMDNVTHLCQFIKLPYSKDFNIHANYKKIGSEGNITAILITPVGDPERLVVGESERCKLEESTSFGYKSCPIQMNFATQQKFLVCVSSTKGDSEMYEVKSNNEPPITSYNCERGAEGIYNCQKSYSNYFIKVQGAEYSRVLNKEIEFEEWGTSENSMMLSLMFYIAAKTPEGWGDIYYEPTQSKCSETLCLVPITVHANKSGEIEFSNLNLKYKSKGAVSTTKTFYDLTKSEPYIESVEGINLINESYILEIPFSKLKLKTPSINETSEQMILSANYNSEYSEDKLISVYKGQIPKRGLALDIENYLNEIDKIENPTDPKINELAELMGYKQQATEVRNDLNSLATTLETEDETVALQAQYDSIIQKIPKDIEFIGTGKDILLTGIEDIPEIIIPSGMTKEEVYFQQNKVKIDIELDNFVVTNYDDSYDNVKLITKKIMANEHLNEFNIFEIIDQNVVNNVDEINFKETPEIIRANPIVKFNQMSLSTGNIKNIVYAFKTTAPEIRFSYFNTVIIEKFVPEPEPQTVCGDGICEGDEDEFNCPEDCKKRKIWPYLLIILIIAGGATYYIMFYKGKYSLDKILPKKNPFHSKKDLEAVMNYIKKQKEKKKNDEEIKKMLISKGWKKKQIDYAFEEIENEKAKKEDLKSIEEYVKRAKKSKVKKEKIKENLLKAGWDKKLVEEVLKN